MSRISSSPSELLPTPKPPVAPVAPIAPSAQAENRQPTDSERQIAANQARVEAGIRNLGVMLSIAPSDEGSAS